MYKGTALDTICYMETGDRATATVQLGIRSTTAAIRRSLSGEGEVQRLQVEGDLGACGYERMDFWGRSWNRLMPDKEKVLMLQSMKGLASKPAMMPLLEVLRLLSTGETDTCLYDGKAFFHEEHLIDPAARRGGQSGAEPVTIRSTPRAGTRCCRRSSRAPTPAARRAREGLLSQPWAERRHARAVAAEHGHVHGVREDLDPQKLWAAGNASENRLRYAQATLQLVPRSAR